MKSVADSGAVLATAQRGDVLDVVYRTVDSPIGTLLVAATPRGLVQIAFACEDYAQVLDRLAAKVSPQVREDPARLDAAAFELDEYFAGKRNEFDVPVDFAMSSGFRQTVQRYLMRIGYGHTQTYRQVAEAVGNAKAMRAVGSACATNPVPIVVPCHRVLRTDGSLGGYRGGLEAKAMLLELESAV